MNKRIDIAALSKSSVGAIPPPVNCGLIGHLDRQALRWIAASPLMFAAFGDGSGINITIGGGQAGFAGGDTYELRLPVARLDDPALAVPGQGFGSLFLLPCIGDMMRVNGTVRAVRDGVIRIAVEECHGHGDKALIRSAYWAALLEMLAPRNVSAFEAADRFMTLATVDATGRVELSPRNDPAGILARIAGTGFANSGRTAACLGVFPQPQVAMLMVLGAGQVTRLWGNARLSADRTDPAEFVFRDDTSALAAIIENAATEIGESPTLLRLGQWPAMAPAHATTMPLADRIGLNRDKGVGAELARAAVSVRGVSDLLRQGLETDHKSYLQSRSS